MIIFCTGSKAKCEKRTRELEKSLATVDESDESDESDLIYEKSEEDEGSSDEDIIRRPSRVNVNSLAKTTSNMSISETYAAGANATSTITHSQAPTEVLSQQDINHSFENTNKPEFQQIIKTLTSLTDVVGSLSNKLDKHDQNTDQIPIVSNYCI